MSNYIKNQTCGKCHKVDLPLCSMNVGDKTQLLCYDCAAVLILDYIQYASMNLKDEFESKGYDILVDNRGGYVIKKRPD